MSQFYRHTVRESYKEELKMRPPSISSMGLLLLAMEVSRNKISLFVQEIAQDACSWSQLLQCIRFLDAITKHSAKNNLREEGFIWTCSSRE